MYLKNLIPQRTKHFMRGKITDSFKVNSGSHLS